MGIPELTVTATFILVLVALVLVQRQLRRRSTSLDLRPLPAYVALRRYMGMVVESGRPPLMTLGRGSLYTAAGPASVAGLEVLREVAETIGQGELTPQVTVGAATLLPIAQDALRRVAEIGGQPQGYDPSDVQFMADDAFPFAYAAGTGEFIERGQIGTNIAVGRFGAELAIIGEAAVRDNIEQVMGSDDPSAIAIALASTENSLLGEEIFVAGAYLRGSATYLASVQVQDGLRWLLVLALLVAALLRLLGLS